MTAKTTATSSAPAIVELKDVSKVYKSGAGPVQALEAVSLTIKKGEVVAIMGPSGSGKSTLMHIIAGLDKPTTGEVLINNVSTKGLKDNELSKHRNQTVGFVFQFFYLQQFLNVQQNAEIPLVFSGVDKAERQQRASDMLTAVGLGERLKAMPNELSGGQMQRVAIARALVNRPALVLADEPTGNLDRKTGEEVVAQLLKARDDFDTTVIIVTHDDRVAAKADRTIAIEDGRLE